MSEEHQRSLAQLQKLTSDNADLDSTLSLVQGQLSSAKTQLQVRGVSGRMRGRSCRGRGSAQR